MLCYIKPYPTQFVGCKVSVGNKAFFFPKLMLNYTPNRLSF